MWAGIEANVPVINGYSGNVPPNYVDFSKPINMVQLINWLDPAGKASETRFCTISPKEQVEPNNFIYNYSLPQKKSFSSNFRLQTIKLPIEKIFSQQIKVLDTPKSFEPKVTVKIPVLVKNTSNFLWSNVGEYPTNFSYRWIDADGKLVTFDGDGERTPLPFELSPGESAVLNAVIKTPPKPGKYSLVLTMVQERVAWFNEKQAQSPNIEVTIT